MCFFQYRVVLMDVDTFEVFCLLDGFVFFSRYKKVVLLFSKKHLHRQQKRKDMLPCTHLAVGRRLGSRLGLSRPGQSVPGNFRFSFLPTMVSAGKEFQQVNLHWSYPMRNTHGAPNSNAKWSTSCDMIGLAISITF